MLSLDIMTALALVALGVFLHVYVRNVLHSRRVLREHHETRELVMQADIGRRGSRDLRLHAREMLRAARKANRLDLLKAANERQLEADPRHPLALQVAKLLEKS